MGNITLNKLADKARNNDWTLTNEESIQIFLIIPDSCSRDDIRFRVNGLGMFYIK